MVESRIDDPLENGDDSTKFVAVGDDLGNGSVHAEVETSLDLELGDFFPNVVDLPEVRFIEFKSAIESVPVVFADFEVEFFEVWNAVIHTLNHLVLEFEKSRVVERDPYMAGESRGRVMTHRTETELKFVWL